MNIEIVPLIAFVIVTTFTPGPNNLSSASMGILVGYRKTVNYLLGIAAGFFVIMILCAYLSSVLLTILPAAEQYFRWIGAAYILWLAIGFLRSNYSFAEPDGRTQAFTKGFVLQLFNPTVAVYGLTLYSTFLAGISDRLAVLAFFAAAISNQLKKDRSKKIMNAVLSLLLVYTAIALSEMAW